MDRTATVGTSARLQPVSRQPLAWHTRTSRRAAARVAQRTCAIGGSNLSETVQRSPAGHAVASAASAATARPTAAPATPS